MDTLWWRSSAVLEEERTDDSWRARQEDLGARLAERLRLRRDEIAHSLMARVHAVSDPHARGGADYALGLVDTVSAALDHSLTVLEGKARAQAIPTALLEQTRAAARSGVNLDTVLRRYLAGYALFCDQLLLEAERDESSKHSELRQALSWQSAQFDRLLATVTDTYRAEVADRHATSERRRTERVRRLLDGDLVDTSDLGYELEGWHLGVVARGPSAPGAIRELAATLDRRTLLAFPGGEIAWGWLGGRHPLGPRDFSEASMPSLTQGHSINMAIGEPAEGVDGLRLTHQQAKAVLPVAIQAKRRVARYSDFAIVASAWEDSILSRSLSRTFLVPLVSERGGGSSLLRTLQAYFAAGRNAASAASGLGVSRQTVNSRLRAVEERIGRSLDACGPELETALRLWELGHPAALAGEPR